MRLSLPLTSEPLGEVQVRYLRHIIIHYHKCLISLLITPSWDGIQLSYLFLMAHPSRDSLSYKEQTFDSLYRVFKKELYNGIPNCMASVTKTFTLKGVQTIHHSVP
jgi:hypothetical protein